MKKELSNLPVKPKIETDSVPVEWLHDLALREGNSKKPIYRIHKWWARRLGTVFRTLLLLAVTPSSKRIDKFDRDFYSKHEMDNLVVMDPFMGGGTSIIEATKLNTNTIGVDIDPVAWFITKKEVEFCRVSDIKGEMSRLEEEVGEEIASYYVTQTPDDKIHPVIYFFWTDLITCPNCTNDFEGHPHYQLYRSSDKGTHDVFCKQCHNVVTLPISQDVFICKVCGSETQISRGNVKNGKFTCPYCNFSATLVSIAMPEQPIPKILFAVEYAEKLGNGRSVQRYKAASCFDFELYDKAKRKFERIMDELPFPRSRIPTRGRSDPRPINHGYAYYYQLFNSRQLLSLSLLFKAIEANNERNLREYLMIAFSDALASNNLLCRYAFGYRKMTPLFGIHAYSIVTRAVENNVWGTELGRGSFQKCVNKMLKGKEYAIKPYEYEYDKGTPKQVFTGEQIAVDVSEDIESWRKDKTKCLLLNRSSTELDELDDASVDLILTDPPYYDNFSYSELSDFFYVWLRDELPNKNLKNDETISLMDALFVDGDDKQSHDRFIQDLEKVFSNCNRVLKRNGLMVFTFHHLKVEAWKALAQSLWGSGFMITNVFPVRSEGKSGFHSSDGTVKWDAVLVCRPTQWLKNEKKTLRGHIASVRSRQERWENRLKKASLDFEWVDSLSLGYAFAVQKSVEGSSSREDIEKFMSSANDFLLSKLSADQLRKLK